MYAFPLYLPACVRVAPSALGRAAGDPVQHAGSDMSDVHERASGGVEPPTSASASSGGKTWATFMSGRRSAWSRRRARRRQVEASPAPEIPAIRAIPAPLRSPQKDLSEQIPADPCDRRDSRRPTEIPKIPKIPASLHPCAPAVSRDETSTDRNP